MDKTIDRRKKEAEMDKRRYLTRTEVDKLIAATKGSRNEARDCCLILLMFRHGLRVSEACGLTLADVDLDGRSIRVSRLKSGLSTMHPLRPEEVKVLKIWLAARARKAPESNDLFISWRKTKIGRRGVALLVQKYREKAGLALSVHPHMLRHACGFALADQGADTRLIQDYLGHKNIQHTVWYTATNPARFDRLW
jgi:type 1 fimbriae regulatory protein FimB